MGDRDQHALQQRLQSSTYVKEDVLGALRGEKLPEHLGYDLIKLCIISGILHHPCFAEGEASVLRGIPDHPEYTRALNARAIMSNRVQDLDLDPTARPDEIPYCIWYPEAASEATYRQLAKRYPELRYQVARGCAVGGYTKLYLELDDVLPEVSVAEEARDAGSTDILEHIIAQPVQYKVMDDCYRMVSLDEPKPSPLNGDTCVSSMIKRAKQKFSTPRSDGLIWSLFPDLGFENQFFNLLEDQGIAETAPPSSRHWSSEDLSSKYLSSEDFMLDLLSAPLPEHLPPGNKDFLILMAAYHGNIDRYHRLVRPKRIEDELFFVVRGIYHHTLFALWWERQQDTLWGRRFGSGGWRRIKNAIVARRIMSNDLSSLSEVNGETSSDSLPYLIWHPELAEPSTYEALAHRVPQMRESCLRAAIHGNMETLFDKLLCLPGVVPNQYLRAEAYAQGNPHYLAALQARAEELGVSEDDPGYSSGEIDPWKINVASERQYQPMLFSSPVRHMACGQYIEQAAFYDGIQVGWGPLELFLLAPKEWRVEDRAMDLDYVYWPEGWMTPRPSSPETMSHSSEASSPRDPEPIATSEQSVTDGPATDSPDNDP